MGYDDYFFEEEENGDFLNSQVLPYAGSKSKKLDFIETSIIECKAELGEEKAVILDGFSGSGMVSRMLKRHASLLFSNDLESYAAVLGRCYLANRSEVPQSALTAALAHLNVNRLDGPGGFIERLYAPASDLGVRPGERAFFTRRNAQIIDNMRAMIEELPPELRPFCLGPLLIEASERANTSGSFKSFHKTLGGESRVSMSRIGADILLSEPVFSNFECEHEVLQGDINTIVHQLREVDIAYFDPPCNAQPYGSNYFMLNLIAEYVEPQVLSTVAGIPVGWNKSAFNAKAGARKAFERLLADTKAKFILISYGRAGVLKPDDLVQIIGLHAELREVREEGADLLFVARKS